MGVKPPYRTVRVYELPLMLHQTPPDSPKGSWSG